MQSHRGKIQKKTMKPVTKIAHLEASAKALVVRAFKMGGSHEKKRQKLICIIGRETDP